MGNPDAVPGEIATHVTDLNGSVVFSGTFPAPCRSRSSKVAE